MNYRKLLLVILTVVTFLFSCNNDKRKENKEDVNTEESINDKTDKKEVEEKKVKLPSNIVQLNDKEFKGDGIIVTKFQVNHLSENKYIYKIFFKTEDIELLKSGNYAVFIQNYPYKDDLEFLAENFKKTGIESYWLNLKTAKEYKDEYVVFRSFSTNIEAFEKTIIGVRNMSAKQNLLKEEFQDSYISN
ncbi:hypothetical protein [uncultured Aquimarina sp.]|uniref:hypothetical protein n=1 Tax=uncultured Aquimarina sp. TaxID=575652 RepID=UPI0026310B9D|nr:hypothetical protein [uncultured Aquimarina sp.]